MNIVDIEGENKVEIKNLQVPSKANKIGVRPEHISLANTSDSILSGTIRHIENLGEHLLCYINTVSNSEITAKLDINSNASLNQKVDLKWDISLTQYFDSTDQSIK